MAEDAEPPTPMHARVLVVAGRAADEPALAEAVRLRASRGPALFHLLVPSLEKPSVSPARELAASERELARALPQLDRAAGRQLTGSVSHLHDPMDAIEDLMRRRAFDEILLATTPQRLTSRLGLDLPRRVAHLGLPLTTVITAAPDRR